MRLLLVILFISISYANTSYNEALKDFNNQNYKKAYKEFTRLLKKTNYKNIEYNYYFGKSAYKLKLYNQAIAAFDRILTYKANDGVANFELAKIYLELKQSYQANYYFNNAIIYSKNKKFLKKVKKYIQTKHIKLYKSPLNFLYKPAVDKLAIEFFKYKEALKNFHNKNYNKSYKQFVNLLKESHYKNVNYNYYIGNSTYKLKLYHQAISVFNRILFYKPNDENINFELAKIYLALRQFYQANYYFDKIISHSKNKRFLKKVKKYIQSKHIKIYKNSINFFYKSDDEIANEVANFELAKICLKLREFNQANYYLDKIIANSKNKRLLQEVRQYRKRKYVQIQKHSLSFVGIMGAGYDSNINNNLDNKDKFFTTQLLIVNDIHRYMNFDINNHIVLFNKDVFNSAKNNFSLLKYKPSILYKNTKSGLITEYSRYANHPYMERLGLFSQLKLNSNKIELQLSWKKHLKIKDKYRDAYHIMMHDINYYKTKHNNLYTTIQFDMESAKKASKNESYVDYKSILLKLKDNYLISNKFILSPIIGYKFKYYSVKNETFDKYQQDNNMNLTLQLLNKLKNFNIQSNVSYIKNISNINSYGYEKWLFNINLIKQFQGL